MVMGIMMGDCHVKERESRAENFWHRGVGQGIWKIRPTALMGNQFLNQWIRLHEFLMLKGTKSRLNIS